MKQHPSDPSSPLFTEGAEAKMYDFEGFQPRDVKKSRKWARRLRKLLKHNYKIVKDLNSEVLKCQGDGLDDHKLNRISTNTGVKAHFDDMAIPVSIPLVPSKVLPQFEQYSCSIIPGYKTETKLVMGNYLFNQTGHSTNNNPIRYWECKTKKCLAGVYTIKGKITRCFNIKFLGDIPIHAHNSSYLEVQVEEFLGALKKKVVTSVKSVKRIVKKSYKRSSLAKQLPPIQNVIKYLTRVRVLNDLDQPTLPQVDRDHKRPRSWSSSEPKAKKSKLSQLSSNTPDQDVHKCNMCGRCYSLKSHLMTHIKFIHKHLQTQVPMTCSNCSLKFKNNIGNGPWNQCCLKNLRKYYLQRFVKRLY